MMLWGASLYGIDEFEGLLIGRLGKILLMIPAIIVLIVVETVPLKFVFESCSFKLKRLSVA